MFYTIIADSKKYNLSEHTIKRYNTSILYKVVFENYEDSNVFFDKELTIYLDMNETSVEIIIDYLRNYPISLSHITNKNLLEKVYRDATILGLIKFSNDIYNYLLAHRKKPLKNILSNKMIDNDDNDDNDNSEINYSPSNSSYSINSNSESSLDSNSDHNINVNVNVNTELCALRNTNSDINSDLNSDADSDVDSDVDSDMDSAMDSDINSAMDSTTASDKNSDNASESDSIQKTDRNKLSVIEYEENIYDDDNNDFNENFNTNSQISDYDIDFESDSESDESISNLPVLNLNESNLNGGNLNGGNLNGSNLNGGNLNGGNLSISSDLQETFKLTIGTDSHKSTTDVPKVLNIHPKLNSLVNSLQINPNENIFNAISTNDDIKNIIQKFQHETMLIDSDINSHNSSNSTESVNSSINSSIDSQLSCDLLLDDTSVSDTNLTNKKSSKHYTPSLSTDTEFENDSIKRPSDITYVNEYVDIP